MNKAIIFQKNINSIEQINNIEFVESLNNSLVSLNDNELIVDLSSKIHKFQLDFFEEDMFTKTFVSKFINNQPFRLVIPHGLSLKRINQKYNSLGAFAFASLNPNGYAIHFIIICPEDNREIYP